jgi:hypothetical protein
MDLKETGVYLRSLARNPLYAAFRYHKPPGEEPALALAWNTNNQRDAVTANDVRISANIVNFQQRVAGILPIRVDVPRAGNSYKFVRPLVLDEETKVTIRYKSK